MMKKTKNVFFAFGPQRDRKRDREAEIGTEKKRQGKRKSKSLDKKREEEVETDLEIIMFQQFSACFSRVLTYWIISNIKRCCFVSDFDDVWMSYEFKLLRFKLFKRKKK